MKMLKQPVTTSMPTRIKNHRSKGNPSKERGKNSAGARPSIRTTHQGVSNQPCPDSQTFARLTSLDPGNLEKPIEDLSDLRASLTPEVASTIPTGKRLFVTPEPNWDISAEKRKDGKVLLFRHPGIGWLGFIIPHKECERLAKKLTA